MSTRDFSDHLASLKQPFLNTPGIKSIEPGVNVTKYLDELTSSIIFRNEIFFRNLKKAKVTLIDSETPLHFSLPKGEIFLTRGLINKYIKHESMLVSILSFELVKSEKILYLKDIFIPIGYVNTERLIALSRFNLDDKMEIHKWAYNITVRSGYDGEYYLSWLQVQNRNTADFISQTGDPNLMAREESLFKAFLIKNSKFEIKASKKNSSKDFYTLLTRLRDGVT